MGPQEVLHVCGGKIDVDEHQEKYFFEKGIVVFFSSSDLALGEQYWKGCRVYVLELEAVDLRDNRKFINLAKKYWPISGFEEFDAWLDSIYSKIDHMGTFYLLIRDNPTVENKGMHNYLLLCMARGGMHEEILEISGLQITNSR